MAEMGLAGKVAIVTGAGSRGDGIGNGRAAAILLAREGAHVALLDAMPDWAEVTRAMITAEGGNAMVVSADVADEASCAAAVQAAVGRWGRVDVLVNNVGIAGPTGGAVEVDPAAWDSAMRINVASMMLMAKACIPEMRKAGGGAVVNLSSIDGIRGGNRNLLYATSKGAVVALTRAMAAQHGPEGIRVNCVAPGYVFTPMVSVGGMDPGLRQARQAGNLLGVEGTGWDVGQAVVFLASAMARWVTGVVLPVDGGTLAGTAESVSPLGR